MKYSVIIPTLNEEKLLPKILNQLTLGDLRNKFEFEIIISDGGSKDKTIEIAKNYADKVIVSDEFHQTIAKGRNLGAEASLGSILIFINGDVYFDNIENFFFFIQDKFENSKHVAMTCKVKVFPHEERLSDKLFHAFYNTYFKTLNLIGVGMGRGECQVIRKRVFNEVGKNNENLIAGEDFDLFMRLKKKGSILFTDEICVYESPRRYRKIGYWGVTSLWFKNSVSVVFKKKSISLEWEQVR